MGLAPVIVAQVFELVRRVRAEGNTVPIVEQNLQQALTKGRRWSSAKPLTPAPAAPAETSWPKS